MSKKLLEYEFVNLNSEDDHWGIRIEDEVTIKIGNVNFEEQKDETLVLQFGFTVIDGALPMPASEFKEHVGDIIMAILHEKYNA